MTTTSSADVSRSEKVRRAIALCLLAALLVALALCGAGCQWLGVGTHYKHVVTDPNTGAKTKEVYHDYKDRNLGRIDLDKVPRGQELQLPAPPGGVSPSAALSEGFTLQAVTDTGDVIDVTAIAVRALDRGGYMQHFASGATFVGMEEETSGQTAVLGEQVNGALTRIGLTIIGYQWAKTTRAKDANDLSGLKNNNKLKAFEAGQETKQLGIEAAKEVDLKALEVVP